MAPSTEQKIKLAADGGLSRISPMQDPSGNKEATLLEWAMRLCPDSPRKRIKAWIASGRFYLSGEVVTQASLRLPDPGAALTLGQPDVATASWAHRKRVHPKLSVLHLDNDLAIVDKSAGLLSVPTEGQGERSALSVLSDYLNNPEGDPLRRRLFGSVAQVQAQPVHRLDQYTSGLLCIAMNETARKHLIEQLREHTLEREYLAFGDGRAHLERGTWRHFLKLDDTGYIQSIYDSAIPGSTEAITHFVVEKIFQQQGVTRLRIRLETGLKHQIRIQAAAAGMPLIGDRHYHPSTRNALTQKGLTLPYGFKRQALHATAIGLKHPTTGRAMRFESKLPKDLLGLEARLR